MIKEIKITVPQFKEFRDGEQKGMREVPENDVIFLSCAEGFFKIETKDGSPLILSATDVLSAIHRITYPNTNGNK